MSPVFDCAAPRVDLSPLENRNRTLRGALFGERETPPIGSERAIVHLVGFDAITAAFLSEALSEQQVETTVHRHRESLASHLEIQSIGCAVIDAGELNPKDNEDELRDLFGRIPTVVIADLDQLRSAVAAMKLGAVDLLERPLDRLEALCVVKAAIRMGLTWHQWQFCRLELQSRFSNLTPRERQVLKLVARGKLNKQIAWSLGLQEITVKVHRGSVMRKMNARSLADLIRMADALAELEDVSLTSSFEDRAGPSPHRSADHVLITTRGFREKLEIRYRLYPTYPLDRHGHRPS